MVAHVAITERRREGLRGLESHPVLMVNVGIPRVSFHLEWYQGLRRQACFQVPDAASVSSCVYPDTYLDALDSLDELNGT